MGFFKAFYQNKQKNAQSLPGIVATVVNFRLSGMPDGKSEPGSLRLTNAS